MNDHRGFYVRVQRGLTHRLQVTVWHYPQPGVEDADEMVIDIRSLVELPELGDMMGTVGRLIAASLSTGGLPADRNGAQGPSVEGTQLELPL